MTEKELKKKIVEVLNTLQDYGYKSYMVNNLMTGEIKMDSHQVVNNRIADALIAAGLKFDVNYSFTAAFNSVQAERERDLERRLTAAEHRAEVAEKALDLCETAYILSLNHRATEGISGQAIASDLGVHKFFMEQAEKELAEEKKE